MASSTDGSRTSTLWKRRDSAASFSMNLRYSFSVVAPTTCSSPRDSAGLRMLAASMAPSALPAPTRLCSSSTNRITFFTRRISSMTALMRSSNWPRYFVPATISARSSEITRLPCSSSGTSPLTMACARPSAMAVLPTPASPSSAGLFFVRRHRMRITRSISSARPITGSSAPCCASAVRSRPNVVRAGVLESLAPRAPGPGPSSGPSGSPPGSSRGAPGS